MADVPYIKRWTDGRQVVVTVLTDTEARVRIGDEYRILPIAAWRLLPLYRDDDHNV